MQGFNKYYPPNYDPSQGSVNKINGKHALGDRARKIDQGILITRFEMPYNIWCGGCDNHIGMGVRYNAEKSKVGMYFTTPIFNFRCKCHLCSHWFEIRTDPQNTRYVVHSGARQKNEEWDAAEGGAFVLEEKLPESTDAFTLLDRSTTKKVKALSAAASLDALENLSHTNWSDPYAQSQKLRKSFRKEKVIRDISEERAGGVKNKYGLGDRVRLEDLRTPREGKVVEDLEWEEAKRERERREIIVKGKRRREEEQVGWKEVSSSSSKRGSTSSSRQIKSTTSSTSSSSLRIIKPIPSSRSKLKVPPSKALQSLASKLGLNSALKLDPFNINSISGTTSSSSNGTKERKVGVGGGELGIKMK